MTCLLRWSSRGDRVLLGVFLLLMFCVLPLTRTMQISAIPVPGDDPVERVSDADARKEIRLQFRALEARKASAFHSCFLRLHHGAGLLAGSDALDLEENAERQLGDLSARKAKPGIVRISQFVPVEASAVNALEEGKEEKGETHLDAGPRRLVVAKHFGVDLVDLPFPSRSQLSPTV